MKTVKIVISGKGGDGTQTLTNIIGQAAFSENKNCSSYPIYDANVYKGVSDAYLIISGEKILNPVFGKKEANIIIDLNNDAEILKFGNISDEIKNNKKLLGMFFLGAVISKLLQKESLMTAIKNNVPEEYYLQNIKAFEAGVATGITEQ